MWPYDDVQPRSRNLDDALVMCVGDFCRWVVGGRLPIVRGWANAVSRPNEPYVMVTPFGTTHLAQSTTHYLPDPDDAKTGTATVHRSMSRRVQCDFYGEDSERQARTVAMLFQNRVGASFLADRHLSPLTASNPQELTAANGAEQAEIRWMVELEIQPWPDFAAVDVHLDFFDEINIIRRPL